MKMSEDVESGLVKEEDGWIWMNGYEMEVEVALLATSSRTRTGC